SILHASPGINPWPPQRGRAREQVYPSGAARGGEIGDTSVATSAEELGQQRAALPRADARGDGDPVVEPPVVQDAIQAHHAPRLRVRGPVDEPIDRACTSAP